VADGAKDPAWANGGAVLPPAAPPSRSDPGWEPPRRTHFERGDHPDLAQALLDDLPSDHPPVFDHGAVHSYSRRSGIWSETDDAALSRTVQRYAGAFTTDDKGKDKMIRLRATDVGGAIKLARDRASRPGFFDTAPHGLCFQNGFLTVRDGVVMLLDHAPENGARHRFGFDYDDAHSAPRWRKCLLDAFDGDHDAEDKIACLQEFAGASLLGAAWQFQKAVLLRGFGSNAKSTLMTVIASIFPPGSTCAVPPQIWGHEYNRSMIVGKLLNAVHELPEGDIMSSEDFKGIVDGTTKQARDPREKSFNFKPRAGHIFSCNGFIGTADHSHAFFRRWIPIVFNRTFEEHEKVYDLDRQIVAEERNGIILWAIDGARRLLAQNGYTMPSSSLEALEAWKRDANPVASFIAEKTRPAKTDAERVSSKALFEAFVAWCEANKFKVMSSRTFGLRMSAMRLGSEHTRDGQVYPVVLLKIGEPRYEPDVERDAIAAEPQALN
jgi:P4 family phage/plasmid primase-like protien